VSSIFFDKENEMFEKVSRMDIKALFEYLENKDIEFTQTSIANIIGMTRAGISHKVKNGGDLIEEHIEKIEDFYSIKIPRTLGDEVMLDYYPDVFGSCGGGSFVLSETRERISVPRKSFLTRVMPNISNFKKYSVINAVGDSMQPFIYENDKLIVEHYDGGQIKDNKVYVFCYDNEIFVKRLVKNITQVVIKSDNTLYDPIKIDGKDPSFMIIGEIVGMLRDMS
jgi:phage repressor protein C with HTH and peptisase S24 domain